MVGVVGLKSRFRSQKVGKVLYLLLMWYLLLSSFLPSNDWLLLIELSFTFSFW